MVEANTGARVTLPHSEPLHFLAGHGRGLCCVECGSVITRNDLEYEIEWSAPARIVRMHARCYEMRHAAMPPAQRSPAGEPRVS
jgi:hypothetical protein